MYRQAVEEPESIGYIPPTKYRHVDQVYTVQVS